MIPTLISMIVFATHFECIQQLDEGVTNRPKEATVSLRKMDFAIVTLKGAHAVLRCKDGAYTVHIL